MAGEKSDSIWTRTFILLCTAQFFGYAQHAMLAPALPLYVSQLGGSPFIVGVVLSTFAATSVIIRPLTGHWADRWRESGVMISGLLFQGVTIFFCLIPLTATAMLANGLRGIGWAGLNTGGYSLLARIAPERRRGEASGYYSGVQSAATIFFPAVALWILGASWGGFAAVFSATALVSFIGAAAGWAMTRHLPAAPQRQQHPGDSLKWWREIFRFIEPEIFLPSALLFWLNITWPSVMNFLVLYARDTGIGDISSFFVVAGCTSLLGRPLLGRASDRIGRAVCIALGFFFQAAALTVVVVASSLTGIIAAGILYMIGNSIGSAATLALAVERANPLRRGKAMASFSVAYPLAYGVGSLLTGSAVEALGYTGMFLSLVAVQVSGIFMVTARRSRLK